MKIYINLIQSRTFIALATLVGLLIASRYGFTFEQLPLGAAFIGNVYGREISLDDIKDLVLKQGASWEQANEKNKEQIAQLKIDFNELEKRAFRPKIDGQSGYFRNREEKHDLAQFIRGRGEIKSMASNSGPDGGWTVQPVLEEGIGSIARDNSALRELITFTQIEQGDRYEEMLSITPVGAKWVAEGENRPATETPQLVKVNTVLHESYAEPVISQRLVDDSSTAMVDFLVNECGISFAEAEENALFYGSGVNQPRGLDTVPVAKTGDATREFGTIEYIPTGEVGSLSSVNAFDAINDLFYSLKAGYRKNAKWVCNSKTALTLSKVTDADGNYLWAQGNIKDGTPTTLLGKPVVICETCPSIAANSKSLWFGDWNQALRGIERPGSKLLLDPYSNKPNIVVYVYRRMGLQLRNSNALKCLKFSSN